LILQTEGWFSEWAIHLWYFSMVRICPGLC